MDPGNTPADPGKARQDPHATCKKVSQNPLKIWSGRVPGASRIAPGPFRNALERRKSKKSIFSRYSRSHKFCRGRFWRHFGTRPGAQNPLKTGPGTKKCVRRRRRNRFLSFFLAVAVRSRSPDQFLEGVTLQNPIVSLAGARF